MKNKKIILAAIAFVAVLALMVGVYFLTRPKPVEGEKTITVTIVHKDKTEKTYTITTKAESLSQAMNEKGLLGEDHNGIYYTVDGETTDYNVAQSWWRINENGVMSEKGANDIMIHDGGVYQWVYTIGW